ncbi:uncharacterized protein BJ171DRAFT_134481 [Polychytrium aggregatum]|uniref:uncharacterized protein n=1 Tax=Polychytrium aggregatum TaxID=110093 RepID=UPI0022FED756|nr:uncharacterized protein BJ171DRAFT_200265 [Polychytrium aggregatum]XP_052965970.1 uncharacterized protein BJ171DRAFT_134481 [Polychytrium aggregatum]KAI9179333.1 hypothetical protein BJ171DRAFT_200265 [Polychytrium aggregatum]KAI9203890.1 hypothetical protein BJ171DRAFT_134481 [Polychytrium aggregatum]
MLTTTSNQLYSCPAHGTDHDLFLSYQAQTDADTVQALKEVLTSVALRRYGKPLSVFHDVDCLNNPSDPQAGSISALPTSKAVFLLLSKASMDMMKDKALSSQEDNVVLEIRTALDLKDAKRSLPVLPLGIATKETKDGIDVFTPFLPYMVSLPDDPALAPLKQILGRVNQIQSFGFRPDQMHKRVYRLLNLVHPIPPNMDLITVIHRKYFCDSKFRFDPAHLDTLLKQLTLTGRAVISGMGGMGKSVLAIQILFFMMGILNASNKDDLLAIKAETIGIKPQYRQVFWLNCSTESTAIDGLCEMFDGAVEPDEIKEYASRFLANTHGYLLVLDNVDDIGVVDSVFEHSKSVGFSGDVVVTTRLASLPPGAFVSALETKAPSFQHDLLRLGNWDDKTTLDYIMSSSPMIVQRLVSDEAKKSLDNIVAKISGYPLVIQTFMTFAENYDTPLLVLEATFAGALELQDGEDDTRSSLKVIVDLSLDSLMKRGDEGIEAARLFGALSLVAPTNIQFELIKAIAVKLRARTTATFILEEDAEDANIQDILADIHDESERLRTLENAIASMIEGDIDVADLIKMMVQSGLLRSGTEGQYSTHSLTQQVAREYVQAHEVLDVEMIEDGTGEVLLELIDITDSKAQLLSEHLDQYAQKAVPQVYTKELHYLIDSHVALLAHEKPFYTKAMETYKRVLERIVAFYGTREHLEVAKALNNMGAVSRSQGRLDDALAFYQESLDMKVKVYGTREHPGVAQTLNNLGLVASDQGRLDEALTFYQESLDIKVKVYGTREHPDVASILNNMGNLACDKGYLDEALTFFQEGLDITTKIYGSREHPDAAQVLNNMGLVAVDQGRLDDAFAFFQESLDIKIKIYGTLEHPDIAQTLNNMGMVASDQGRLDEALAYYQESLNIKVKVYGTREHPVVATTLGNMGNVAFKHEHLEEALVFFQEALAIWNKTIKNTEHIHVKTVMSNIEIIKNRIREHSQLRQL